MRVLVVADLPPDPDSGAAGTVMRSSQALRAMGHEVTEIWRDSIPWRIRHGNLHMLIERPRAYRDLVRRASHRQAVDVIQVSHAQGGLAAKWHQHQALPSVFVSRTHGLEPMVDEVVRHWQRHLGVIDQPTHRRLLSRGMRMLLNRHLALAARWSDGFMAGASDSRAFLGQRYGVPTERVAVIPHGLDGEYTCRPVSPMTSGRAQRVLMAGQFTFCKGPHITAAVFSRLAASRPDIELAWLCGAGDHQRVRALLDPVARDRVRLLDWRPRELLMSVYDHYGIFLFPSFFEGFGKAFLEAMSRGMCVVAARVGGMRDIIAHEVNGLLFDSGDVAGMADAILEMVSTPERLNTIGTAARETASRLTWDHWAIEATAFYERLLEQKMSGNRAGNSA